MVRFWHHRVIAIRSISNFPISLYEASDQKEVSNSTFFRDDAHYYGNIDFDITCAHILFYGIMQYDFGIINGATALQ